MYRVYVGQAGEYDHHRAVRMLVQAETLLALAVGGFTKYQATGRWHDDDGHLASEATDVYEIETPYAPPVMEFAHTMKAARNQQQVLVVLSPTTRKWEI